MWIAVAVLMLVILSSVPAPHHSVTRAAVAEPGGTTGEIPFGGARIFNIVCTCSANTLIYLFDFATLQVLALVYQPGASIIYQYFNVIYSVYLLGSYIPGAGQCKIYVGKSCAHIQADGMLGNKPGTGTSE